MSSTLQIDFCSFQAAKYAVERWHYSKRMPKYKQVYIGVWENGKYIGATVFGLSVTPYLGAAFGLTNTECAELTRVALARHKAPVSKIVSYAIRKLKTHSPGLLLLVSYADPVQGHHGGIYQAMNWIFVGESAKVKQYYFRGQWRNDSSMGREFRRQPGMRAKTESRELPPKYKYLYPLTKAIRKKIEPLRKQYPRKICAGSKDGVAPCDQQGEGGSIPTPALHIGGGK